MKIVFHTLDLDKTFYRQQIQQYIADHIKQSMGAYRKYRDFHKHWTINIHPVQDWDGTDGRSRDTGTLNGMIPHGVTGEGVIKVYVVDDPDKGLLAIQNLGAILHEVAHMLLIIMMRGQRGIYRNNDLSGNKKGMDGNISTQEVHDRQMEGRTYQVKTHVNFGNWLIRKWVPYTCIGIDLRDFISQNV